jgi:hypothetical protein
LLHATIEVEGGKLGMARQGRDPMRFRATTSILRARAGVIGRRVRGIAKKTPHASTRSEMTAILVELSNLRSALADSLDVVDGPAAYLASLTQRLDAAASRLDELEALLRARTERSRASASP